MFINTTHLTWQRPEYVNVPAHIMTWLTDSSSLTQKLKDNIAHFKLNILSQQDAMPHDNEKVLLNALTQTPSVREVLLLSGNQPVVFARSIIPYSNDTKMLFTKRQLPLGEVLFQNADIKRSHLQISQTGDCWGRRNIFQLNETNVLVAEFFLPALFNNQQVLNNE